MKKTLYTALLIASFLFLCVPSAFSAAQQTYEESVKIAQNLRSHLSSLSSLTFVFTQRTKGQMSGRPKQASGEAFFVKTDNGAKMRWNYLAPDRQVIISDGVTLQMYFEKLNQLIITSADSLQEDITYSFFTGEGDIEETFVISNGLDDGENEETEKAYSVIKLTPKSPTSQIQDIRLWITNNNEIKRLEIRDTFETLTMLNLSNTRENSLLKDGSLLIKDLFTFSPPEGTEIINQ